MSTSNNDINELAHFKYPTHFSYVFQHQDSGRIHCIKYSKRGIVWEHFEYGDWDQCKEYMITDLPESGWGFVEEEE